MLELLEALADVGLETGSSILDGSFELGASEIYMDRPPPPDPDAWKDTIIGSAIALAVIGGVAAVATTVDATTDRL